MRGDINFGFGVFHSAVLRARLRRRRKLVRAVLALLALVIAILAARPLLQGTGVLVLTSAPADAVLTLDGQPLDPAAQRSPHPSTPTGSAALTTRIWASCGCMRRIGSTALSPLIRPDR